ncbi:Nuclear cap-binding protein subunit 1 [Dispira parvispora]|uniref:Nuclear cap-binding protein subunit 1 n=1 Tax=Dispira parvispora TaxID=1520584 RepID=A0A9W8E3S9_9FUNG|nr:Nuclear cap-binding protein subunit 1 [Dispira parvispora]
MEEYNPSPNPVMEGTANEHTEAVDQFGRTVRRTHHRAKPYDRPHRGRDRGFNRFGGGRGGRNAPISAQDRHRLELEELEKRLATLIIKVGDKLSSSVAFNLEALAGVLCKEYHRLSETILRAFQGVVTELPMKTEIYATLVGLINARQPEIAEAIVRMAWDQLVETAKDTHRYKMVKLWLRFFACLTAVGVVLPASCLDLLRCFINAVVRDDPQVQDQGRADTFVYMVMITLPWVGRHLDQYSVTEMDALFQTLQQYVQQPSQQRPPLALLQRFPGLMDLAAVDPNVVVASPLWQRYQTAPLQYVYHMVEELRQRNWEDPIVHRTYEKFSSVLAPLQPMEIMLAALELPPPVDPKQVTFTGTEPDYNASGSVSGARSELETKVEPMQAAFRETYATKQRFSDILPTPWIPLYSEPQLELVLDHFIVYDMLLDTMDIFHVNRKDAASYLTQLQFMVSQVLWQAVTTDESDEVPPPQRPILNIDQLVVTSLFSRLFQLPSPPHKTMYYSALTVELCKFSHDRFFPLLSAAISDLFATMPTQTLWSQIGNGASTDETANSTRGTLQRLAVQPDAGVAWDIECIHRFADWFAMYLSNGNYTWDWQAWADTLQRCHPATPALTFVHESLSKCIRLSYMDRIKTTIPEDLQPVVMPDISLNPNFRYDGSHPLPEAIQTFANALLDQLNQKEPIETIQSFLENAYQYDLAGLSFEELAPVATASSQVYGYFPQGFGEVPSDQLINVTVTSDNALTRVVRDVFVQCVLFIGRKSFSHMLNVIERYLPLLKKFGMDADAKHHIVETVNEFWKDNPQFVTIIVDKLLNYRVVSPLSVLTWALNPLRVQFDYPAPFYVWETLRNTIHKLESRIQQIDRRIHSKRSLLTTQDTTEENPAEVSTLENIAQLESTMTSLQLEQKDLLLSLFQNFSSLLATTIKQCIDKGVSLEACQTYLWISGRYREIMRTYHTSVKALSSTLETIVFTEDVHPLITTVFKETLEI